MWNTVLGIGGQVLNNLINDLNNKRNKDYMDSLTKEQQKREDTAIQRAVADAKNAGLSPLTVAGSGASSSSPLNAVANAGSFDLSQVLGLALSSAQLDEQKKQNIRENDFKQTQLEKQLELSYNQLEENKVQFEKNLEYNKDKLSLEEKNVSQDLLKFMKNLELQETMFSKGQDNMFKKSNQEYLQQLSLNCQNELNQIRQRYGVSLPTQVYTNIDEYYQALNIFNSKFSSFLSDVNFKFESTSGSGSANVAFLGGGTVSSSQSNSYKNTEEIYQVLKKSIKDNSLVYPVFHYKEVK